MKTVPFAVGALLLTGSVLFAACSERADANPNSPSGQASSAQTPSAQTALRGTEWSLVEIDGKAVTTGAGERAPTLLLAAADSRASGFAGCNQFSGAYKVNADNLQLSSMVMTRMFCTETMDLEKQYVAALESARTYRMTGPRLELLADGKVLAAFEKR